MSQQCFVYVLRSEIDGTRYVGISKDPIVRLREHNYGMNKYTKGRKPFKLIYQEVYDTRLMARQREKYLKSGVGRELLNKLIPL